MFSVLAVARQVTKQREETVMCPPTPPSSASYVKERNIQGFIFKEEKAGKALRLRVHIRCAGITITILM